MRESGKTEGFGIIAHRKAEALLAGLERDKELGLITDDQYKVRQGEILAQYKLDMGIVEKSRAAMGGAALVATGAGAVELGVVIAEGGGIIATATGGLIGTYGLDSIVAGGTQVITGEYTPRLGTQLIADTFDIAPGTADLFYDGGSMALGLGAGLFMGRPTTAGAGGSAPLIKDVKQITAAEANAGYSATANGWQPPYAAGGRVTQFTTAQELEFLRFSTTGAKETGSFLVRASEVAGMTPAQIQQHLALSALPEMVQTVRVPAGTLMHMGRVGPQPNFGYPRPGGIQYQLKTGLPDSAFGTRTPIK